MGVTLLQHRNAVYWIATALVCTWPGAALSQNLAPFDAAAGVALHPAWVASSLPADKGVPRSRFSLVPLAGETVLELTTNGTDTGIYNVAGLAELKLSAGTSAPPQWAVRYGCVWSLLATVAFTRTPVTMPRSMMTLRSNFGCNSCEGSPYMWASTS